MEEIGRRLQAARLAKGLTLQDVEDETRIRKKYVEALESGRLTNIPGEVYVKGFLRSYGNFLGLDGEAMVEEYKSTSMGGPESQQEEPPAHERAPRPSAAPSVPRLRGPGPSIFLIRRIVVVLLVLAPLVAVGWWLWGQMMATPEPPPVTEVQEPPVQAPEPEPEPEPEPPRPTVTMTGPTGSNIGFAVSVSPVDVQVEGFRQGTPWMEVVQDGKVTFQGYLKGSESYTGKELSIRFGFGQGMDLVINGQKFSLPEGGPYTVKITGAQ